MLKELSNTSTFLWEYIFYYHTQYLLYIFDSTFGVFNFAISDIWYQISLHKRSSFRSLHFFDFAHFTNWSTFCNNTLQLHYICRNKWITTEAFTYAVNCAIHRLRFSCCLLPVRYKVVLAEIAGNGEFWSAETYRKQNDRNNMVETVYWEETRTLVKGAAIFISAIWFPPFCFHVLFLPCYFRRVSAWKSATGLCTISIFTCSLI